MNRPTYFGSTLKQKLSMLYIAGIDHEQNRQDRDNYVRVLWENVIPGYENAFTKNGVNTPEVKYNINSVMHYLPNGRPFHSGTSNLVTSFMIPLVKKP